MIERIVTQELVELAGSAIDAAREHPPLTSGATEQSKRYARAALTVVFAKVFEGQPRIPITTEMLQAVTDQANLRGRLLDEAHTRIDELERLTTSAPQPVAGVSDEKDLLKRLSEFDYQSMPKYGEISWRVLREAAAEAMVGDRTSVKSIGDREDVYVGHQIVGINFNSLNRIISAFVRAALLSTPPQPAPLVLTEEEKETFDIAVSALYHRPELQERLRKLSLRCADAIIARETGGE